MSFTTTTLQFGGRRVLVAHPNERQYGHLGLEILMSLVRARETDADVYFVRPSTRLGGGLFELESPEVRVLRPVPAVRELLRACISWRELLDRIDRWRYEVREQVGRECVREATRYVANQGALEPSRTNVVELGTAPMNAARKSTGKHARTRPAPPRSAPRAARIAAPSMPSLPATKSTVP